MEKEKLNDDLLDQVSGGAGEYEGSFCFPTVNCMRTYECKMEKGGCGFTVYSDTMPDRCLCCARRGTLEEV